jgi:hypothetical protein
VIVISRYRRIFAIAQKYDRPGQESAVIGRHVFRRAACNSRSRAVYADRISRRAFVGDPAADNGARNGVPRGARAVSLPIV